VVIVVQAEEAEVEEVVLVEEVEEEEMEEVVVVEVVEEDVKNFSGVISMEKN
jgi:hypothetical protein